jgi:hypothetical protein
MNSENAALDGGIPLANIGTIIILRRSKKDNMQLCNHYKIDKRIVILL